MRSITGMLSLLLAVTACGPKPATEADEPAPATPDEVVAAAKGLVEQYRQAYTVRSPEALVPLYAHTLDVTVTHQGRSYQGWSEVEDHLNELLEGAREIHVEIESPSVVALGTGGAAVTAEMSRSISDGVAAVEETGSLTLALRLEDDRWVIVKEHFSYPPGIE